ncbi:GAF and ANTAR domain-containing protein [Sphaerisporangium sp. B11E5]|uniref:GAF and ANTAR domain-containing protein n=1 Tax=Sphaerisporangium sp. B11E5 TaxID=3153563 RepID=UPI00325F1D77
MTRIDPEALVASLRGLQKTTEATGVVHHLERIVRVVDRLFGYAGAGLMFADESKRLRYLVTTDEAGRSLEHAQAAVGRGPCVSAFFSNGAVTTSDVQQDERWPDLAPLLHPSVRAVAGVPVRLGNGPVGTLNVYQAEPQEWEESDTQALMAYAHVIEEVLAAAVRAEEKSVLADQLQYALDYRIVIERAIGYLMGKHDITAAEAFTGLRKRARDSRRRVADLAAEILGEQAPPA